MIHECTVRALIRAIGSLGKEGGHRQACVYSEWVKATDEGHAVERHLNEGNTEHLHKFTPIDIIATQVLMIASSC